MVVLGLSYRAGALRLGIVSFLIARLSSASDDVPTFPHLESRFETLNITCEDEVQNLVNDWQVELDALIGPGGQAPMVPPAELANTKASPFAATRPRHAATQIGAAIQDTRVAIATLAYAVGQEHFACCANGDICTNGVCSNPIYYTTVTNTIYSTQYVTAFNTIFNSATSTIQSTVFSTAIVTVSTEATATSVNYVTSTTTTTIKPAAKRTADIGVPITVPVLPTASAVQAPLDLRPPKVYVKTDKRLDVLAEKLAERGLVVERAVTSTVQETAYATVTSFYTSVVSSAQTVYVTNIVTNIVTSTSFSNAQTTVQVVSTIVVIITVSGTSTIGIGTVASATGSGSNTPTHLPVVVKLSTGVKAGIGIGAVLGAAAIAALVFFTIWWRRSKKDKGTTNPGPAGSNQPDMYVDPAATFYGPAKELAAVGVTGAAAHHVSEPSTGANTVEPVSPTSTNANLRNTGQWQQPTEYQQPQQAYQGYPPPGYGYGASSPPPQRHDPGVASPQNFQGGYPQNMAEMQGQNTMGQGQYGNYPPQHPQAQEMPVNQPIQPYGGT